MRKSKSKNFINLETSNRNSSHIQTKGKSNLRSLRSEQDEIGDEDDISTLINKNEATPSSSTVNKILPSDMSLLKRSMDWASFFEKIENSVNPEYYDAKGIPVEEIPFDEEFEEDDEIESEYSTSFEDDSSYDDPDFDMAETINNTLPALIKRKQHWHEQNDLDKTMDSFSSSKILEVSRWLDVNHNGAASLKFNEQNNDEDSSCCSLEMTQYIKKNSCPKMNSSKFNQRIKLNKMRNSLMLNKYCEPIMNFCHSFGRRSYDNNFYNVPSPFLNPLMMTDQLDLEIYRRLSCIPENDIVHYRNNRLPMYNSYLYSPTNLFGQHEYSNLLRLPIKNMNFENEIKQLRCNECSTFNDKSLLSSTSYENLAGNIGVQGMQPVQLFSDYSDLTGQNNLKEGLRKHETKNRNSYLAYTGDSIGTNKEKECYEPQKRRSFTTRQKKQVSRNSQQITSDSGEEPENSNLENNFQSISNFNTHNSTQTLGLLRSTSKSAHRLDASNESPVKKIREAFKSVDLDKTYTCKTTEESDIFQTNLKSNTNTTVERNQSAKYLRPAKPSKIDKSMTPKRGIRNNSKATPKQIKRRIVSGDSSTSNSVKSSRDFYTPKSINKKKNEQGVVNKENLKEISSNNNSIIPTKEIQNNSKTTHKQVRRKINFNNSTKPEKLSYTRKSNKKNKQDVVGKEGSLTNADTKNCSFRSGLQNIGDNSSLKVFSTQDITTTETDEKNYIIDSSDSVNSDEDDISTLINKYTPKQVKQNGDKNLKTQSIVE